ILAYRLPTGLLRPTPWTAVTRYTPTLTAIRIRVTSAGVAPARRCTRTIERRPPSGEAVRWRPPACSGQRIPTGAGVMQSVQIGRPHSEHESPVGRSG